MNRFLPLVLLLICFSCSNEENETTNNNNNNNNSNNDLILGSWGNYQDSYIACNGVETIDEIFNPYYEVATFYEDGTATTEINQSGTLLDATWENLGNGNYEISILGLTDTFNVQFLCDGNIMKWNEEGLGFIYFERLGYNNDLCDEDLIPENLVYIPDDNFEQYLINRDWDDILDDYVQIENISYVFSLDVSDRNISDLTGIEGFCSLEELFVENNNLTFLNVSNNPLLTTLVLNNNQLCCVEVNQEQFNNIPSGWEQSSSLTYAINCSGQECEGFTYIPDDDFEQALIDLGVDDNLDNWVLTENISSITSLDVHYKFIDDLTGIEDFVSLEILNARENNIESINLSANTNLIHLDIHDNQLNSLDISNNPLLEYLDVSVNNLMSIDISTNNALNNFQCYGNQLTSLDLSSNIDLASLRCDNLQLTSLDVSNNTALTTFYCHANQLTNLDISNNTALVELRCFANQLISLDVSNNIALEKLVTGGNQLTNLDISGNFNLTYLSCSSNELTSLNVQNGNNYNFTYFSSVGNSDLTCIQVDDSNWSTDNWTNISTQSYFSENCN